MKAAETMQQKTLLAGPRYIKDAFTQLPLIQFQVENQELSKVLFLGSCNAGKSTLINYLLLIKNSLIKWEESFDLGCSESLEEGSHLQEASAAVNHYSTRRIHAYAADKLLLLDTPGLVDTHTSEGAANYLALEYVLQQAKNIKLVVVIDYNQFTSEGCIEFINLAKRLAELLPLNNLIKAQSNNIVFLINKTPTSIQYRQIIHKLRRIKNNLENEWSTEPEEQNLLQGAITVCSLIEKTPESHLILVDPVSKGESQEVILNAIKNTVAFSYSIPGSSSSTFIDRLRMRYVQPYLVLMSRTSPLHQLKFQELTQDKKYEVYKNSLPSLVDSAASFNLILLSLAPEEREMAYEVCKDSLPELITSIYDLSDVLRELRQEQRVAVCYACAEKLPLLIKSLADFSNLVSMLPPEQHLSMYRACKEILYPFIHSATDLAKMMRFLSPADCITVCLEWKELGPAFLNSAADLGQFLGNLTPEQYLILCQNCKVIQPNFFNSTVDLGRMIRFLPPAYCATVCLEWKEVWQDCINSAADLGQLLRHLTPEQCLSFCQAWKAIQPNFISSVTEFSRVLGYLELKQSAAVRTAYQDLLPELLASAADFSKLMNYLTPKQRTAVCVACELWLPNLIGSLSDFFTLQVNLDAKQRRIVYTQCKEKLLQFIDCVDDFSLLKSYLSPVQITALCIDCKDLSPHFIKSAADFQKMLDYIAPKHRVAVCEAWKNTLPSLVYSLADFTAVLERLNPAQQEAFKRALTQRRNAPYLHAAKITLGITVGLCVTALAVELLTFAFTALAVAMLVKLLFGAAFFSSLATLGFYAASVRQCPYQRAQEQDLKPAMAEV